MIIFYPEKLNASEINLGVVLFFPKLHVYKEDESKEAFYKTNYKIRT